MTRCSLFLCPVAGGRKRRVWSGHHGIAAGGEKTTRMAQHFAGSLSVSGGHKKRRVK